MVYTNEMRVRSSDSSIDEYLAEKSEEERKLIQQELDAVSKLYESRILSLDQYNKCKNAILFKTSNKEVVTKMTSVSERYCRGEITISEYEECQMKATLQCGESIEKGHVKRLIEKFKQSVGKENGTNRKTVLTSHKGKKRVLSSRIADIMAKFEN